MWPTGRFWACKRFNQYAPTTACRSSVESVWPLLTRLGLFIKVLMVRMETLPTASIAARSLPFGLQQRCWRDIPSWTGLTWGTSVGSDKSQEPSTGWQRIVLNSRPAPLWLIDATLPNFDHAIPLARSKRRLLAEAESAEILTDGIRFHEAHLFAGRAL